MQKRFEGLDIESVNESFHPVTGEFSEEISNVIAGQDNGRLSLGLMQARKAMDLIYGDEGKGERDEMIEFAANRLLEKADRDPGMKLTRKSVALSVAHEVSQRLSAQVIVDAVDGMEPKMKLNSAQEFLIDQARADKGIEKDFRSIAKGGLSEDMASDLDEAMSKNLTGRLGESMVLADREFERKEVLRSSIMQNAAQSYSFPMGR